MSLPFVILILSAVCIACGTAALALDVMVGAVWRHDFFVPSLIVFGIGILGIVVTL
jgi:hypothetical protein